MDLLNKVGNNVIHSLSLVTLASRTSQKNVNFGSILREAPGQWTHKLVYPNIYTSSSWQQGICANMTLAANKIILSFLNARKSSTTPS